MRREGVSRASLDYPTASLIIVVGTEAYLQLADSCLTTLNLALAPGQNYESGGLEFESLRARQILAIHLNKSHTERSAMQNELICMAQKRIHSGFHPSQPVPPL